MSSPVGKPAIDWGAPTGDRYSISEIVALTAVPSSSIHHYRRLGLVPEPQRTAANRFVYDERHIVALRTVRSLRRRGHSLVEIHAALPTLVSVTDEGVHEGIDPTLVADATDHSPEARLIDAAIEAFAEQGYRDVSVSNLCERAGVAKGTFYRCFPSKDALFLVAARAVVERAVTGFTAETAGDPSRDHAAAFAVHLRPGLPVLFELAKRSIQDSGPTVHAAVTLFADLADRLGRAVSDDDADPSQAGGLVVMLAVVEIFADLLRGEIVDTPTP